MIDIEWLSTITTDPRKLKREAVKRRKKHQELSVVKSAVQEYIESGWEIDRELKIKTSIRKPCLHDEMLENSVWYLFYLLGYPEISSGRNFQVTIHRKGAEPFKKQIDVLAKDDESVVAYNFQLHQHKWRTRRATVLNVNVLRTMDMLEF